jgi:hypothetical protein
MGDRAFISREQWPPSSSTADRRRPHVRIPSDSQRQHARFPSEAPSNRRFTERAPSGSTWSATDTGLPSKPQVRRKRVRAEKLWDRDEEELLQRRTSKFASSVLAEAGDKVAQAESGLPPTLHELGGGGDDPLHSDLVDGGEQVCTRPDFDAVNHAEVNIPPGFPENQSHRQAYTQMESDALNYIEDNIPSRSPDSQSRQQAYTQPEVDVLQYTDHSISPRSRESQNHLDLKRPRDRYLDDYSTRENAEFEPQKRRRNKAGYTQSSTMDNDLSHKEPQDALIDVLLKKLADEQGKTRAVKQELKRLQYHDKDRMPKKRKKGKKKAAAAQRERKTKLGKPSRQWSQLVRHPQERHLVVVVMQENAERLMKPYGPTRHCSRPIHHP